MSQLEGRDTEHIYIWGAEGGGGAEGGVYQGNRIFKVKPLATMIFNGGNRV